MHLLLLIIYLAFISLGLPDSLLGSAWPVMQLELGVDLSWAGIITMIISGGTIISSLMSDRVIHRFGTGMVTAVSVGLTALALFGFSVSTQFWVLCVLAVPFGFGAGAVDAALNNYVALHYSSRHMSWLHAFWGVGATISPNIMSWCLASQQGWAMGYRTVSILQIVLTAALFASLPLWKRPAGENQTEETQTVVLPLHKAVRLKGAPYMLIAFFALCALEASASLWAASYLAEYRGMAEEKAAMFSCLYYMGEMAGRFLNGFATERFGDKTMIRAGAWTIVAGVVLILLPLQNDWVPLAGLLIAGIGSAPVYPCIIHSTPDNFGRAYSQSMVGIQMASAYIGSTFMPPVFGVIAQYISISLYPAYLLLFAVLMLVMTEKLNLVLKK